MNAADLNSRYRQVARKLVAKSQVLLAIALRDLDGIVDILDVHVLVRHVRNTTRTTTSLEIDGHCRWRSRPDLDASPIGSVVHADIVYVDVLHDVDFPGILAQGAHRDAVGAIAMQVLYQNLGTVWFEGHAIIAVVDDRVLDYDIGGSIPAQACQHSCHLTSTSKTYVSHPSVFFASFAL